MDSSDLAIETSQHGPRAWPCGILRALLALACIALVMTQDQRIECLWNRTLGQYPATDTIASFFSNGFTPHVVALVLLLLAMLDPRLRWRFVREGLWMMAGQMVVSTGVKRFFGRVRPDECGGGWIFFGPDFPGHESSFPSGHATGAWALAALMSAYYPRWRWAWMVLAVMVSLSRIQRDRHFFSDGVAGAFLGWYVAWFVINWLRRRAQRQTESSIEVTAPEPREAAG